MTGKEGNKKKRERRRRNGLVTSMLHRRTLGKKLVAYIGSQDGKKPDIPKAPSR